MQRFTEGQTESARLGGITPFFIVEDIARSKAFYVERLGFSVMYEQDDFAVMRRDGAQLMIKMLGPETLPMPNPTRHPWAKWDAYVATNNPDALWAELAAVGLPEDARVTDTSDGQRGCQIRDP